MSSTRKKPKLRIIETASKLFHKQGYNSTGINQIISEASVAKASLYKHFNSKEELAIVYLNVRHDYWFENLKSFTNKKTEPKEIILAAFDFLVFMNEKENFRGCSFLNLISEIPADNTVILDVIQNHKSDLRQFFWRILKQETLEVTDHIFLLFESCLIESQVFKSNWPIEKSKSIVTKLI